MSGRDELKLSFGADAEQSHCARPNYPPALPSVVLPSGGWNFFRFDEAELLREAAAVILEHVPQFSLWPGANDAGFQSFGTEWRDALDETGYFQPARISVMEWALPYTGSQFLEWIRSLSWFRTLPDSERQALLARLEQTRVGRAPQLDTPLRTLIVTADKPSGSSVT